MRFFVTLVLSLLSINIVQAAALVSAYPIIAVDLHENRLKLAHELGATHILNGNMDNIFDRIHEITGKTFVDVFFDNTGIPDIIELGYRITKSKGRVILVGVPCKGNDIKIHSLPLHFGKTLIGSFGGDGKPHEDIPRYQNLYNNGRIELKKLVHALKFKNKVGNPVGFKISILNKFKKIKGNFGAKFMVKRLKKNTNFIKVSSEKIFRDFDYKKDFN